jgi:hypothetical protein
MGASGYLLKPFHSRALLTTVWRTLAGRATSGVTFGTDCERSVVARIKKQKAVGMSSYAIAKRLNAEGTRTRYGKLFRVTTIERIDTRSTDSPAK